MERRDYLMLVGALLAGAIAGAAVGGLVALATGYTFATAAGGIAGSYLGMVYADWHWGPKSRKVRQKRADEQRRRIAEAERASRTPVPGGAARSGQARRAARKAAARSRR